MSGILPGIALVPQVDKNNNLMRGALLRLYLAGTSTPAQAFKDSALTPGQEHPWPIEANSYARLPMFYLNEGVYRARLSSADGGDVIFDEIIEAVSPSGGGGGGGGGVAPEVIFQTAYLLIRLGSGVLSGYIRLNGRTIGNATSGATERANADVQNLFEYLWGEFDDTICPVIGGRGANATADFNAGKQLTLIDGRGKSIFGADGMGATRANRLTTATFASPDTVGTSGGSETHTLIKAELPNTSPAFTGTPMTASGSIASAATSPTATSTQGGSFTIYGVSAGAGVSFTTNSFTPAGTIAALGSGQAFPTVPPGVIVTYYVKL